jgi:hypothetical protein
MLALAADENVDGNLIRGVWRRPESVDLVRVQDVGLGAKDDPLVLEWAAAQNRVLVTNDRRTMIAYAWDRVRAGQPMPGVLVLDDRMPIGDTIDALVLYATCGEPEDCKDKVVFLQP